MSIRSLRAIRLLALALVFLAVVPVAWSQASPFTVKTSEKIDALLLLDALGSAHPQAGKYPMLDQVWMPQVEADAPAKAGYEAWKGHGIGLAYLFSDTGGETLADLIAALGKPEETLAAVEKSIDEPAYRRTFDLLKQNHAGLAAFLGLFAKGGWSEAWKKGAVDLLQPAAEAARAALSAVDAARWKSALAPFLGAAAADPVEVVVAAYSGSVSFRLKGARAAIPAAAVGNAPVLVTHEMCHRVDPAEETLAALRALAEQDPFYGTAHRRIRTELLEGEEEEYVLAAACHVGVSSGLLTRKEALRLIKFACSTGGMPPDKAGAPVAGIVFAELSKAPPAAGFDYSVFLKGLHSEGKIKAGAVAAAYDAALAEILGTAGVQLALREGRLIVVRAIVGFPAKDAGLADDDEILAINGVPVAGDLNKAMEQLAGGRGDERSLTVRRGDQTVEAKFRLK